LENLSDIENEPNYHFEKADIIDSDAVRTIFIKYQITDVIHLAAESHVDRSIEGPMDFVMTNVVGTVNLLQAAKESWKGNDHVFHHVSTDEVYGSLGDEGLFTESTSYDPRSPYSASKASSDHFVMAYFHTYGLPIKMSNCSNNYGSHHFPEKLIPLMIHNIQHNKPLPVYGKGDNIRDWLWVEDHASAIDTIFHQGRIGESYNVGGLNEWTNIELVRFLCQLMDEKLGREKGESEKLITYVTDRAGHDKRYAIDASKLENELNWMPSIKFEEGLSKTVDWYLENQDWVNKVTSGSYKEYYENMYDNR
jgi:dTDP-glucose 4,6-dehydratase